MKNNAFLQQVAADLLQRYGSDLSRITVVFPNRRARLFFNEYLTQVSDKPVWAPVYADITELFYQASSLQVADSLKLLSLLYQSYTDIFNRKKEIKSVESFDEFYFFGEMLLSDFNDIDKHLVNPQALFSNLAELDKFTDDFKHLEEEQRRIVARFFNDISAKPTFLKDAFYSIWSILGEVYTEYCSRLAKDGIAFQGMLFRSVVEQLQEKGLQGFEQEKYIFVGFNVLNTCEKSLFKILKQNEKALFYWDYDQYYMAEQHEAGRFMRDNLASFPCALSAQNTRQFTESLKNISFVESPSESAQAGYIPTWLEEINYTPSTEIPDTVIVLCNEQNLQSVIHAIPGATNAGAAISANLTMGFPFAQTPVFSLISALVDLQLKGVDSDGSRFRYTYVLPVLQHPYIRIFFPEAIEVQNEIVTSNNFFPTAEELRNSFIFRATKDASELSVYLADMIKAIAPLYNAQSEEEENPFSQLYNEAFFRAFQLLNRLQGLIQNDELRLEKATLAGLLRRMLSQTSIPFHGEPARGLQVMGLLETRNMDFKNVMMLSVNEGVLPKTDSESSFIPHFIRKFFGMTTIEHQDSLYAYYFYRLLQRAENVSLVYSTAQTQTGKLEKSRYLLQLLIESNLPIKQVGLKVELNQQSAGAISIAKTPELLERLYEQFDQNKNPEAQRLSASAINEFIDCSLRFYLHYIAKARPPKEITDELDNSVLGSVFHKAMELIYRDMGKIAPEVEKITPFVVTEEQLSLYIKTESRIERAIELAFDQEFFKNRNVKRDKYNGEQLIYFRIIKQFVLRMLRIDKKETPFTIVSLEGRKYRDVQINNMRLRVGGVIDRIDRKENTLRVVDYKTGGSPKDPREMAKLFSSQKDRANYVFQAFLYSSILSKEQPDAVRPALVYIQKATTEDYSPIIEWNKEPIADFHSLADEFEEHFLHKLAELFDASFPFAQTDNQEVCKYCDFKRMCGRMTS
jgi:CRISPR/Cas system-associated exonuclease Cas4 (RecB family)